MTQTDTFVGQVLGHAEAAAHALRIPVAPILAQWINETGSGTSKAFKNGYNPAGISILEDRMKRLGARTVRGSGQILYFPDLGHATLAYVVRWNEPVYTETRARWAEHNDPDSVARAMQDSPWAEGHYAHHGLVDLIHEHNLTRYDGAGPAPAPGPSPVPGPGGGSGQPPCGTLTPGPAPHGHHTLKVGARGGEVAEVQQLLAQHGHPPANSHTQRGGWDGIFGPGTATAVAEFQSEHGLHRDGIVGRQTWCAFGIR